MSVKKPKMGNGSVGSAGLVPVSSLKNAAGVQILVFSSLSCAACEEMESAGTVNQFAQAHPDTKVKVLNIADEQGRTPRGTDYDKAYDLSDEYEVESTPTIVFVAKDGGEISRLEGFTKLREMEREFEDVLDSARTRAEAAS